MNQSSALKEISDEIERLKTLKKMAFSERDSYRIDLDHYLEGKLEGLHFAKRLIDNSLSKLNSILKFQIYDPGDMSVGINPGSIQVLISSNDFDSFKEYTKLDKEQLKSFNDALKIMGEILGLDTTEILDEKSMLDMQKLDEDLYEAHLLEG